MRAITRTIATSAAVAFATLRVSRQGFITLIASSRLEEVSELDLNLFVIGIAVMLVLIALGLMGPDKDIIWAMFPALGGVIGIWFSLAILADGSILIGSQVIASASTSGASDWQFIELTPIVFTLGAFMSALYKGMKAV